MARSWYDLFSINANRLSDNAFLHNFLHYLTGGAAMKMFINCETSGHYYDAEHVALLPKWYKRVILTS
jgi:hypothetical protein